MKSQVSNFIWQHGWNVVPQRKKKLVFFPKLCIKERVGHTSAFFYLSCAFLREIGLIIDKKVYISHSIFNETMTHSCEGWKSHHVSVQLPCCRNVIYSFTIQTFSTPYYRFYSTFSFHLPSCFCSLLVHKYLSPIISVPFFFHSYHFACVLEPDMAFGSWKNNNLCVRLKKSGITCKGLTYQTFYDCKMWYLTFYCHKAQQMRGRGTWTHRQACAYFIQKATCRENLCKV